MNGLTIDDGGDDKWRAGVQDDEDDVGEPGPLPWAQPRRKVAATVWHCCSGSSTTGSSLGELGGADGSGVLAQGRGSPKAKRQDSWARGAWWGCARRAVCLCESRDVGVFQRLGWLCRELGC